MITIPNSGLWGTIAEYLNLNFAEIPNAGSSDHIFKPVAPLVLTNAWQVVQGDWAEGVTPVGITFDNATGVFTLTTTGRWRPTIERIYHQHDTNPATPININIKVQTSDDEITWVDTDFERVSIISAASANDEPAVQSFTTDFFVDVTSTPVYFRILSKADEDGANPTLTELILVKVTSNIIGIVPS